MCIDELIDLLREYPADAAVRILIDEHERDIITVGDGDEDGSIDIVAGFSNLC